MPPFACVLACTLLLLTEPAGREPVAVTVKATTAADRSVARTYTLTLADGSTVEITRRYAPPLERPAPGEKAIDRLAGDLYIEYLAYRIALAEYEADDVLDEAEAAARAHPCLRRIVIPEGKGRRPLEARFGGR